MLWETNDAARLPEQGLIATIKSGEVGRASQALERGFPKMDRLGEHTVCRIPSIGLSASARPSGNRNAEGREIARNASEAHAGGIVQRTTLWCKARDCCCNRFYCLVLARWTFGSSGELNCHGWKDSNRAAGAFAPMSPRIPPALHHEVRGWVQCKRTQFMAGHSSSPPLHNAVCAAGSRGAVLTAARTLIHKGPSRTRGLIIPAVPAGNCDGVRHRSAQNVR